jgi:beta-lactamase superfamily II metal-dependent hydrolase/pimeloyl-ACP methyl ester carboxylesterase
MAWRFHLVSPVSVALNVPLVPLTSWALGIGGVAVVLSPVLPGPARLLAWWAGGLLRASEWLVRHAEALGAGHAFVAGPAVAWVVGTYVLLAAVTWSSRVRGLGPRRLAAIGAGWLVLGIASAVVLPWLVPARLEAEILAVGHGLAVVIRAPDGSTYLYDCGKQGDPWVGRRIVAPALWSRHVPALDMVVLSHPDADHYDGLPDLLDRVRIRAVGVSPAFLDASRRDPAVAALLAEIRAHRVPIRTLSPGPLDRDGTVEVVRVPDPSGPGASDNERSIIVAVGHAGHRFYLTGDLEGRGQADWIRSVPGGLTDAGVVLAPHHGSRMANSATFYGWARPRAVVVSQEPPRAGTRDAMADLAAARGLTVLRTWQRGAVRLSFDSGGITLRGFLDATAATGSPSLRPVRAGLDPRIAGLVVLLLLGLLATALGRRLIDRIARVMIQPRRAAEPSPLAAPPWTAAACQGRDGAGLFAEFLDVSGDQGRVAVLVHGFAEEGAALHDRAALLAASGWSVLLPDQRGRGRSEGDCTTYGALESADLCAWLDWLDARTSPGCVVVWGRSMGAAVALRAATADRRIAALVLEAPYASLAASLAARLRASHLPASRWWARHILERAAQRAGHALDQPRPIDLAPRVTQPVLVLIGQDDRVAEPSEALRLASTLAGRVETIEVPGAGHVEVFLAGGPGLAGRIVAFLDHIEPPAH